MARELVSLDALVVAIDSGHRLGRDYQPIVDALLREVR
jgi:hypothetical protein